MINMREDKPKATKCNFLDLFHDFNCKRNFLELFYD